MTGTLHYRILAAVAAICLFVAIFEAPRPSGILDGTVWPVGYSLAAAASFIIAIRPHRLLLHIWASLIITIQLFRALLLGVNPTVPELRWASISANLFFAILAYFVWAGWKDRFDIEEVLAEAKPSEAETQLADLEQTIADHDSQARALVASEEQVERFRLPAGPLG